MDNTIPIYLESGQKRVIAGALEWPGWCRVGREETAAMGALLDYGPRYGRAIASSGLDFSAPADATPLTVVERLTGTKTTDFGAPDAMPAADARPFDDAELARAAALLSAIWQTFDTAVEVATGVALRKGPRGGGRDLEGIVEHVLGAEASYLARLGWKRPKGEPGPAELSALVREGMIERLGAATRGELPAQGPRGGMIWPARYYVRRSAWHILDHVWEIEDRAIWNAG